MANPALVKAFLNAIGDKESGGDYNAYNGDGNARGKYQFQPATYESAASAAGLDGSDWSPENQENVAFITPMMCWTKTTAMLDEPLLYGIAVTLTWQMIHLLRANILPLRHMQTI